MFSAFSTVPSQRIPENGTSAVKGLNSPSPRSARSESKSTSLKWVDLITSEKAASNVSDSVIKELQVRFSCESCCANVHPVKLDGAKGSASVHDLLSKDEDQASEHTVLGVTVKGLLENRVTGNLLRVKAHIPKIDFLEESKYWPNLTLKISTGPQGLMCLQRELQIYRHLNSFPGAPVPTSVWPLPL